MATGFYSVKPFCEEDWPKLRTIRLDALKKHPNFFCPSNDETQFTEDDWKQRINNPNGCIFGLYHANELIGLTGVVRDKSDVSMAHLVMSYIKAEYRKQNLSGLLYEARIAWAKAQKDIRLLTLDCNKDNLPSQRACEKFGFKQVRANEKTLTYHLKI